MVYFLSLSDVRFSSDMDLNGIAGFREVRFLIVMYHSTFGQDIATLLFPSTIC